MMLKLNPNPRTLADFAPLVTSEILELDSVPYAILERYGVAISSAEVNTLAAVRLVICGAYDWVPGRDNPEPSADLYERLSAIARLMDELDYLHYAGDQITSALAAAVRKRGINGGTE